MNLRFNIPSPLRAIWLPVIERQIDLHLAPLRTRLHRTQIDFSEFSDTGGVCFQCEFTGRLSNGEEVQVGASHSDGHVAVADVLSRVRREVRRRSTTAAPVSSVS